MILIITKSNDEHSRLVIDSLQQLHAQYVCLVTDASPAATLNTVQFDGCSYSLTNSSNGSINLNEIQTVWYRREGSPSIPGLTIDDQLFVQTEQKHFLRGLWHLLKDRFWINPLLATEAAEWKPYQLRVAQRVGFSIPKTSMTNDPEQAIAFFDKCDGQVIYKTFSQHCRKNESGGHSGVYTNRVTREHLLQHKDQIRTSACIFQEYIPKQCEIRVTVIGQKIFAVEIDAQKSTRAKDDWRRYDLAHTTFQVHNLPCPIKLRITDLLRQLNLVFGCIDFIVTPDNQYIFLEINPMGQWYWAEALTGGAMLDSFVQMLMQGEPSMLSAGRR